ncbi:hypothetical protein [Levilactobacillus bambusae]|uniref:Capsular polysaccharide biosynthesis protein CpsC n=1 Tax=Levilactobacillus bambusae TaxID=2024736 RepID=A0A2V1MYD7_9LACO|nr:hypothetical protein [Levilactobacillus bambusae]PWF99782.1 hypothetical protein DCM90_06895 [Levilactobacillus bambusae]
MIKIDLSKKIKLIRQWWLFVMMCGVLGALIGAGLNFWMVKTTYMSTMQMNIYHPRDEFKSSNAFQKQKQQDIKNIRDYGIMIHSPGLLKKVKKESLYNGQKVNLINLSQSLTYSIKPNTTKINVSAVSTSIPVAQTSVKALAKQLMYTLKMADSSLQISVRYGRHYSSPTIKHGKLSTIAYSTFTGLTMGICYVILMELDVFSIRFKRGH